MTSERGRGIIQNEFSNIYLLRKKKAGASNQEKRGIKFNQAKGPGDRIQ